MAQDIRKMFKNEKEPKPNTLHKGHQKRFEDRLEKEFPKKKEQNSNPVTQYLLLSLFRVFSSLPFVCKTICMYSMFREAASEAILF